MCAITLRVPWEDLQLLLRPPLDLHLPAHRGEKRCSFCLNMPKFPVFEVLARQVGKVLYMLHDFT